MYIISKLHVLENKVEILENFDDLKNSISYLYSMLGNKDTNNLIILDKVNDEEYIKEYKITVGTVYGKTKDLLYIYQIIKHDKSKSPKKA